eukprot:CAMPEP_0196144222 /NCGR_PEP_ID=MMETSP0910-20130528/15536_1 /TAXON_ID=49265 /ORGANISM="Thalassiosira rotula, Strain GSO102" /LENGTH=57 /DNA_ID=CAMNT_0041405821 /DNA_START=13 /DNA_END=183 /DNA_ORIENTATION=+
MVTKTKAAPKEATGSLTRKRKRGPYNTAKKRRLAQKTVNRPSAPYPPPPPPPPPPAN